MTGVWTCPDCNRSFGRNNQGHMCAPGMTIDEFFADSPPYERPIYEAVHDHLASIGEVYVEAVQVGIFFKNGPVFAELRPKKKWVALTFHLPMKLDHPRLSRKVISAGGPGSRWYHVVNVADVSEIDDTILDWLTEAYLAVDE